MDPQTLINFSFAVIGSLFGWILKTIWDAVGELRSDLKEIERDLPENYVRRDDFKNYMDRIESICIRIYDKLDNKVDKA